MVMSLIESLTRIKNAVYGREVREAIHDGIFRANQVVDANKNLVDQVAIRQDAVEQYNNQMIAEMTDKDVISAPELIESRDGEDKLSARLDRDFNSLKTKTSASEVKLSGVYTVEEFGAVGDGVTDDADAIQLAFDTIPEYSTLKFNSPSYGLKKPVRCTRDGIKVEWNGVVFNWSGVDELDSTGRAAIEFEGTMSENRNFITNITKVRNGMTLALTGDLSTYNVGDYVGLTIRTGAHNGTYDDYKPLTGTVAKVLSKSTGAITLDYLSPFNYSKLTYDGWITKMEPIKDLKIGDVNFNYLSTETDANKRVHTLQLRYAVGFDIGKVSAQNFMNKGLRFVLSREGNVAGGDFNRPQDTSAGVGYGVQVVNSCKIDFNKLKGSELRHLIDFSAAHHCKVYDSSALDCTNGAFDCHGVTEHDIEFIDCDGDYVFSNGMGSFVSVVENIKILRGTVRGINGGAVHNLRCYDVDFEEWFLYSDAIGDFKAVNCKIKYRQEGSRNTSYSSRGGYFDHGGKAELINCDIEFIDMIATVGMIFRYFKIVRVRGCNIESTNETGGLVRLGFISGVDFLVLDYSDNAVQNSMVRLSGLSVQDIQIKNNSFRNTMDASLSVGVQFIDIINPIERIGALSILWSENSFYSDNPTRWIRATERVGNTWSVLSMRNNVFSGDLSEHIGGSTLFDNIKQRSSGNVNNSTMTSSAVIQFES